MLTARTIIAVALAMIICSTSQVSVEAPQSYPITLEPNNVHEFANLSIQQNGVTLSGTDILVVPIRCELGVSGAMLLGKGEFTFARDKGDEIKGVFLAAMRRFAPADHAMALIPDVHSFVANVYPTTHGDLLISTGAKLTVVHNFTENRTIYPKK